MYTVARSTMSHILRGHLNVVNLLPLLWHHLPPGCHKPPLKCDCTWLQLLMALKRKGFLQRSQSEATSAWKIFLSRVSAAPSSAFHSAAAGVIHRFSSCTSGQQWWWWGAKSLDDRASRTLTLTAAPERCKPLSPIQQTPANPFNPPNPSKSVNVFSAICPRGWCNPQIHSSSYAPGKKLSHLQNLAPYFVSVLNLISLLIQSYVCCGMCCLWSGRLIHMEVETN